MVRKFALVFGIVYALIGILGFVPALVTPPQVPADVAGHLYHGRLFGLFPVNAIHNIAHLAVGVWGIVASQKFASSLAYAKVNALLFGALVILGVIPATNTLFGAAPLYGHDIWLHLINTAVAGWFGFGPPSREAAERRTA